ncbi:MAG TPA: LamG domain-containing protein, partial [Ferruginibacter sp.]|nr:LamG domain-containing protein [Ferruginibacter sp.]
MRRKHLVAALACLLSLNNFTTNAQCFAPQPTISTSGPTTFCSGGSVTLTASVQNTNNALFLDGVNDYVDVVPVASVSNLGPTGFTLEAWVKPTTVNSVKSIIRKTGDYNLFIYNGSLGVEVWPVAGVNSTWKQLLGTAAIVPNVWTHVAATWDGSVLKMYINGTDISSTSVLTNGTIPDSNERLGIGNSLTYGQPMGGNIDELRIWNTSRSLAQINSTRFSFVNPSASNLVAYYKFDVGGGTIAVDATGIGNAGTLTNGATWLVPSTVPIIYNNFLWSP